VSLVYILPLAVAISLDRHDRGDDWAEWTDGHFARIAADHVGDWLSACNPKRPKLHPYVSSLQP
jgi:hypothetical protein